MYLIAYLIYTQMNTHVVSKYINLFCKLNYSLCLATATTLLENFRTKRKIFDSLATNTVIELEQLEMGSSPASSTFTRLIDIFNTYPESTFGIFQEFSRNIIIRFSRSGSVAILLILCGRE